MKYFLIICILIFISCSENKNDINNNNKIISCELKFINSFFLKEDIYKIGDIAGMHKRNHVDNRGNIYLLDSKNSCYIKYSSEGEFTGIIGNKGKGPGEYIEPMKITTDQKGFIYVFDMTKNSTIIYNSENNFFKEFQYNKTIAAPGDLKITKRYKIISLFDFKGNNYYEKVGFFHFLDSTFSFVKSLDIFYTKEYKNLDLKNYIEPLWDVDSLFIYINFTALPYIYKYDLEGNVVEKININANYFKIVAERIPQTPNILKTAKFMAKYSNSFALYHFNRKYLFFCYFNLNLPTSGKFNIWNLNKYRKYYYNIVAAGNEKAQTQNSMVLPGMPLFCDSTGKLFLLLNDEPDRRKIGVYDIVVEEN